MRRAWTSRRSARSWPARVHAKKHVGLKERGERAVPHRGAVGFEAAGSVEVGEGRRGSSGGAGGRPAGWRVGAAESRRRGAAIRRLRGHETGQGGAGEGARSAVMVGR